MTSLSGIGKRATPIGPAQPNLPERIIPGLNGIKRVELVLFSRMMATFIRAGIPILDGIEVVREQAVSPLFRRTLDDLSDTAPERRTALDLARAATRGCSRASMST